MDSSLQNTGEVFQLAAIYPESKICHLTKSPPNSMIPLPVQATKHPLPGLAASSPAHPFLPLPYASGSMHHIRSSRLATLLPAAQIPGLLAECHRVLKPGGILELRLMNPLPERNSMGPKLAHWLEERLMLNLEAGFRCSRPLTLIPQWAKDAGFQPLPFTSEAEAHGRNADGTPRVRRPNSLGKLGLARSLNLPSVAVEASAASKDSSGDSGRALVVSQVGVLVARSLWKDTWGSFVREGSYDEGSESWWWEDGHLAKECKAWRTSWEVGTLIVAKEG
jgi:SAM-dependent methyltransferase